jgi:hypothetical protein
LYLDPCSTVIVTSDHASLFYCIEKIRGTFLILIMRDPDHSLRVGDAFRLPNENGAVPEPQRIYKLLCRLYRDWFG